MAGQAREIELKLDLDPDTPRRGRPRALSGEGRRRALTSRYYDTADRGLEARGVSLRVRQDGDALVQTVKVRDGGGLFDRAEHETVLSGPEPDLAAIADEDLRDELARLGTLAPLFTTEIERTTWRVERDGAVVEVAIDEGRVVAGLAARPICEVELELKEGEAEALFGLAREIAAVWPVRLGVRAKSERGYGLLDAPAMPRAAKAEPIALDRNASAGEAFRTVAWACLRHFRLNEPGILRDRDPNALHQARVALRRLRSALTLFGPVLAGEELERLKRELRTVSGLLGQARNLDVYRSRTLRQEAGASPDEPGLPQLVEAVEADRVRAYDRVVRHLRSRSFRLLAVDLVAFVEAGEWRDRDRRDGRPRQRRVAAFAARLLDRRWRKLRKTGRHLDRLEPDARHRVRISAKKVRYAAEFFTSLAADGKASRRHGRFVKALSSLQDRLGELNDIATGHEMARAMAGEGPAGEGPAGGAPAGEGPANGPGRGLAFAAGHVSGVQDAGETALLASAAKAHRTFRKVKPFWG